MTTCRSTMLTIWADKCKSFSPEKEPLIKYMIYQKEIAPTTKKEHYQAYIKFTKPSRYTEMFNRMFGKGAWRAVKIKKQKPSDSWKTVHKKCINYCKKNDTSVNNFYFIYNKSDGTKKIYKPSRNSSSAPEINSDRELLQKAAHSHVQKTRPFNEKELLDHYLKKKIEEIRLRQQYLDECNSVTV